MKKFRDYTQIEEIEKVYDFIADESYLLNEFQHYTKRYYSLNKREKDILDVIYCQLETLKQAFYLFIKEKEKQYDNPELLEREENIHK